MKIIAVLLLCYTLTTTAALAGQEDAYNKTRDVKKIAWMDKGKAMVKVKLKDPGSAQFRSVYFNRGAQNIPVTCGQVNSKNSLGAYGGFQRFVSGGRSDLTFLEEQVSDFDTAWNSLCQ